MAPGYRPLPVDGHGTRPDGAKIPPRILFCAPPKRSRQPSPTFILMNSADTYSSTNPSAAGSTSSAGEGVRATVRQTAEKARRATGKVVDQAKEKAGQVAQDRQQATAGKIGGYSDRLRESARSMEEEDPNIAHFAAKAADRLQEVADYVRDADFARLRADATDLARRHPVLFMGGMLAAGLVLGNLAKASVQGLHEESDDTDTQDEDTGNGRYFAEEAPMDGIESSFGEETDRGQNFS
jgi:hypothetical protein